MKIKTSVSGGYGGNLGERDVWVLDTDRLSEADRAEVESVVAKSGFFDLPSELARSRVKDNIASNIHITDGAREHSVTTDQDTEQKYRDALKPIFQVVREKGAEAKT
jgi:hypothetical protein